jgi:hypothetical protein
MQSVRGRDEGTARTTERLPLGKSWGATHEIQAMVLDFYGRISWM